MLQVSVQSGKVKKRSSKKDLRSADKKSKSSPLTEHDQKEQKNNSVKMKMQAYRDQRCQKSHSSHYVNNEVRQRMHLYCCTCQMKGEVRGK